MLRTANIIGSGSNGLAAAITPALAVGQVPDFVLGLLSVFGGLLFLFLLFFLIGLPARRRNKRYRCKTGAANTQTIQVA